jgi:hypothetical protein
VFDEVGENWWSAGCTEIHGFGRSTLKPSCPPTDFESFTLQLGLSLSVIAMGVISHLLAPQGALSALNRVAVSLSLPLIWTLSLI